MVERVYKASCKYPKADADGEENSIEHHILGESIIIIIGIREKIHHKKT